MITLERNWNRDKGERYDRKFESTSVGVSPRCQTLSVCLSYLFACDGNADTSNNYDGRGGGIVFPRAVFNSLFKYCIVAADLFCAYLKYQFIISILVVVVVVVVDVVVVVVV